MEGSETTRDQRAGDTPRPATVTASQRQFNMQRLSSTPARLAPSSIFYSGRTQFGGAFSRAHRLAAASPYSFGQRPTATRVTPRINVTGTVEHLSPGTRRILDIMDKMSTPIQDAKKMPMYSEKTSAGSSMMRLNSTLDRVANRPPKLSRATPTQMVINHKTPPLKWDMTIPEKSEISQSQRSTDSGIANEEFYSSSQSDGSTRMKLGLGKDSGQTQTSETMMLRTSQVMNKTSSLPWERISEKSEISQFQRSGNEDFYSASQSEGGGKMKNLATISSERKLKSLVKDDGQAPATFEPMLPSSTLVIPAGVSLPKFNFGQVRQSEELRNKSSDDLQKNILTCKKCATCICQPLDASSKEASSLFSFTSPVKKKVKIEAVKRLRVASPEPKSQPRETKIPNLNSKLPKLQGNGSVFSKMFVQESLGKTPTESLAKPLEKKETKLETKVLNLEPANKPLVVKKSSKWECDTCMVMNEETAAKCVCCETLRSGGVPDRKENYAGIKFDFTPTTSVKFGVQNTSNNSFGITTTTTTTATTLSTNFKFGAPASTSNFSTPTTSTFNFGVPTTTTSSNNLSITTSATTLSTTTVSSTNFKFGTSATASSFGVAPAPISSNFTFGVPTTTSNNNNNLSVTTAATSTPSLPTTTTAAAVSSNFKFGTPATTSSTFGVSSTPSFSNFAFGAPTTTTSNTFGITTTTTTQSATTTTTTTSVFPNFKFDTTTTTSSFGVTPTPTFSSNFAFGVPTTSSNSFGTPTTTATPTTTVSTNFKFAAPATATSFGVPTTTTYSNFVFGLPTTTSSSTFGMTSPTTTTTTTTTFSTNFKLSTPATTTNFGASSAPTFSFPQFGAPTTTPSNSFGITTTTAAPTVSTNFKFAAPATTSVTNFGAAPTSATSSLTFGVPNVFNFNSQQTQQQPLQPSQPPIFNDTPPVFNFNNNPDPQQPSAPIFQFSAEQSSTMPVRPIKKAKRRLQPSNQPTSR